MLDMTLGSHGTFQVKVYENLDVELATDPTVVALKSYKYGIITPITGVIYHYRPQL